MRKLVSSVLLAALFSLSGQTGLAATVLPQHESHVILNVLKIYLGHNTTSTQFQVGALDVLCDATQAAPRCVVRDLFSPDSERTVEIDSRNSARLTGAMRGFFAPHSGVRRVYHLPQLFCSYTRATKVYECMDFVGKTN